LSNDLKREKVSQGPVPATLNCLKSPKAALLLVLDQNPILQPYRFSIEGAQPYRNGYHRQQTGNGWGAAWMVRNGLHIVIYPPASARTPFVG
jgi:hypothetical protein